MTTTQIITEELFRDDAYLTSCDATVMAVREDGLVLDRTVFYPTGGGQPGDIGTLVRSSGDTAAIIGTISDRESGMIVHLTEAASDLPERGEPVTIELDWQRRHRHMRLHSCMHMLCSLVPYGVTGGSISEDRARLDFDMSDTLDKVELTERLNSLIAEDHPMETRWITNEELDAQPDLVRTMSVAPPRGSGKIRLVHFENVDLQPCGGTHVASTAEIGVVRVQKIEKKGKHNRRVIVVFDE
ncbi:MAG: serine-tRNA(Ala) deacylase AlaX [marine bacterium B5-7]|nr:MAG: serine-tRNA(Ala) deacylase AlaX [marine bacterium B5-7]